MSTVDRIAQLTDALAAEILRRQQSEAENVALRAQVIDGAATPELVLENQALRAAVADLTEKLLAMQARVAVLTRRTFGRSSEAHHPDQQQLDEILRQVLVDAALPPDESAAESAVAATTSACAANAAVPAAAESAATAHHKPRTKRRGRLVLPDTLPVEDCLMAVPESQRMGPDGQLLPQIGTRVVEKLDYLPAWFRRLRLIYPIYGVPFSDEPRVTAAPLPCVVPKGLPTDRTVAMVLVDKYDLHCPLYRQETKLERAGINLSRATLMNWVSHGATALTPIKEAIGVAIKQHYGRCVQRTSSIIYGRSPNARRVHGARATEI